MRTRTHTPSSCFREQAQKRAEERYQPPDAATLAAALTDGPPRTAADLQAVMLEEFEVVRAKVRAHPVDWRRGFFDDAGRPRGEERCRDEVLKMLGEFPAGVACAPEGHLAQYKRADMVCTIGELMLPIEVKGQWRTPTLVRRRGAARAALYDGLARQRPRHLSRAVVRSRSRWRLKPEGPSGRRAEARFRP